MNNIPLKQFTERLLPLAFTIIIVSAVTGTLVAFFLWALDVVTVTRWHAPWLIWLLPLAGLVIHFLYKLWGGSAKRGNNLLIDAIHERGVGIPARMAPLVLVSTLITHLFGGSAGREGTAVQIGGSIAAFFSRALRVGKVDKALALRLGIAAGFGAVFGTPLAGAMFAIEVPARGKVTWRALLPCLAAAASGDWVCSAWGIRHTSYFIAMIFPDSGWVNLEFSYLWKSALIGVPFGVAAWLFIYLSHQLKGLAMRYVAPLWLQPLIGGILVIVLYLLCGTDAYLGLGVYASKVNGISIVSAFNDGGVAHASWLWKMFFTVVTLSFGFKGGEVTPLFFIGAALGNTLSVYFNMPTDLCAGLGFIAVFAAAANTPLACVLMGVELFGLEFTPYYLLACYAAYLASGKKSIYTSQR